MSLRVQKPGRIRTKVITHPDRPPIWADGRQHPPFDLHAFLRASLANARAASLRGLDAGAERAAAARAVLPRLATGTQALCAGAANSVRGKDPVEEEETRVLSAVLAAAFPRPAVAPKPTTRTISDDDPTLAAIRSVLSDYPAPSRPGPQTPAPDVQGRASALARLLAMVSVLILLPFGAATALHAHLSGEDLRLSG